MLSVLRLAAEVGKFRDRFLTPNSPLPGGNFVLKLLIPADVQFVMHFLGALTDLAEEINWEQVGSMTPEEAAEIWSKILAAYEQTDEVTEMPTLPLASITPFAGYAVPEGWLDCDGSLVLATEYPDLYAAIDPHYKLLIGSTEYIRLPNLCGRVIVGYEDGVYDINDEGGAETHTLTVAEMPTHNHTIPRTSNVVSAGSSRYSPEGSQSAAVTGNAGGGEPHNNMQPYRVLRYIIRAV